RFNGFPSTGQREVAALATQQRWNELPIAEDAAHGAPTGRVPDEVAMDFVRDQRVVENIGVGDGLYDRAHQRRVLRRLTKPASCSRGREGLHSSLLRNTN